MIVDLAHAASGYGNKATGLARVCGRVPVPPAVAIPGRWITQHLSAQSRSELVSLLAAPDEPVLPRILELTAAHTLPPAAGDELRRAVAGLTGPLAVRSSSNDEDAESLSFAGVFDSVLDVRPAEVADAVLAVWRSGFTPQALLAYRRAGRTPSLDHLNVLVQQAVRPVLAGVAFTAEPGTGYLEWVTGHGRGLVDGTGVPTREQLDPAGPGWRAELARWLAGLAHSDVEWVYDGEQIWIVQVRPRTAPLPASELAGIRFSPLYEGDAQALDLGTIGAEYHRIRAKRRRPRAIALAHGARVPAGWLVNWRLDQAGFDRWAATLPAEIVLDASPAERQHILPRSALKATLTRLAEPEQRTFAFLCREYLKGDLALLSTVDPAGAVYVEASAEGLLALNRGFGSARALEPAELLDLLGPAQAEALAATTSACADQLHPRATLEWVVQDGILFFVDYSAPAGDGAPEHPLAAGRVLSGGIARGRVQRLGIDQLLTDSSIAPIISISEPASPQQQLELLGQLQTRLDLDRTEGGVIVAAARPIAILSMLIGVVDGFLFEEGALLSHLGILLREAGVPAVIVGTGNLPPDGTPVELVHGTVIRSGDLQPG